MLYSDWRFHIMSGLPGSGKSYFCKRYLPRHAVYISRDEARDKLRKAMGSDEYFPVCAEDEYDYWIRYILDTIKRTGALEFFIDQTSLTPGSIAKLLLAIQEEFPIDETKIIIECFRTPLKTCKERNAQREGYARVPDDVIDKMAKSFNITYEGLEKALKDHPDMFRAIEINYDPKPYPVW